MPGKQVASVRGPPHRLREGAKGMWREGKATKAGRGIAEEK